MPLLPANIRVNAAFPFPSLVQGSGGITLAKNNGIWTVGWAPQSFAITIPTAATTSYAVVYDSVTGQTILVQLSYLATLIGPLIIGARTQRAVTASPIVIGGTDQIINCNIATAASCALPASATRAGSPLTFKDMGQAAAHNITFTANGAEKIDGQSTFVMTNNFQAVTFVPFNDGVNSGWSVE